jgi:hypothetical protein
MPHANDSDADDTQDLSDVEADEVISLVRTALGGRVSDDSPVDGDLDLLAARLTKHPDSITKHSVWLVGTLLNISLCPVCGSVAICVFAPMADVMHGCVEVMERLREMPGLGGDPDHIVCGYQRFPVLDVDGSREHVYIFAGTYWLDFDDVGDRVIHATRSLVRVLDEISGMLVNRDDVRRSHSN